MSQPTSTSRREFTVMAAGAVVVFAAGPARAEPRASEIAQDARIALQRLYATKPKAREYGAKAAAILVFPNIVKAGAMIGGQTGTGALFKRDKVQGFFRISAASFGFQLGAQKFSYALFFMNDGAVDYLRKSKGWAVGSGPSLVLVDEGFAKTVNTTTLTEDVYAMAFGQSGLMAGAGLEGSKITQIFPKA